MPEFAYYAAGERVGSTNLQPGRRRKGYVESHWDRRT